MRLVATLVLALMIAAPAPGQEPAFGRRAPWATQDRAGALEAALGIGTEPAPAAPPETNPTAPERVTGRSPAESPRSAFPGFLAAAVIAGIVTGVALLVALDGWRRRRRRAAGPSSPEADPADLLARGRSALREGDETGAVRHFYLFALAHLARAEPEIPVRHLADDRILAALRSEDRRRAFTVLSRAFLPVRYGGHPPAPDAADASADAAGRLASTDSLERSGGKHDDRDPGALR